MPRGIWNRTEEDLVKTEEEWFNSKKEENV